MARTHRDRLINKLLSAYMINECDIEFGVSLSETKLQKLVFLSEKRLIDGRIKAFDYSYIKFLHGPFSGELRGDLTILFELSLIQEPYLKSSKKLKWVIEDFQSIFEDNPQIISTIDSVLERYSRVPTEKLLDQVYRMKWGKRTIGDLPLRTPMLWPLKVKNAIKKFEITSDEFEDLELLFNKKIAGDFEKSNADMKEGRLLPHDQVFNKI